MTLLFALLLLTAGVFSAPAYFISRRRGAESRWLPVAALPAIACWLALTAAGYGAQSLSNMIEIFWILAAAVVLCYLKVFIVDPGWRRPKQATYFLMALLTVGAILLRTLMPVLPE